MKPKKHIHNWKKIKLNYKVKRFFQLYVYTREFFNEHGRNNFYNSRREERFAAVSGYEAKQLAKAAKLTMENGNKLRDDCLYIFMMGKNGRLVPKRVSMHPKTYANVLKGSRKYGSLSILNELVSEGW